MRPHLVPQTRERATKTLYVCRENIGRSQVAQAFHNARDPGGAETAGTQVYDPQNNVGDRDEAVLLIEEMRVLGFDISEGTRKQVTLPMLRMYGRVVVMAELDTVPWWLIDSPNSQVWDVPDLKDVNREQTRAIVDIIRHNVEVITPISENT